MEKTVGIIKSLCRYPAKGEPAIPEKSLVLEAGRGICGDYHSDGGKRQIAVITTTEKTWMQQQEVKGFCFRKYKENLLLDGFSLADCHAGDRLQIGDAVLEIADSGKSCHRELCSLAKTGGSCMLAGRSMFAFVCTGGTIETGMRVIIHDGRPGTR